MYRPCVNGVEDIQPLTDGFLQEISTQRRFQYHNMILIFELFKGQPWQGNGEALYNVLYRACSLAKMTSLILRKLSLKPVQSAVISAMILVSKRG